ncbi:GDP-D-glucose phosphorylase 1 [Chionoecetes opilio]|uniref:GDP-D-glucose phosphorylase 1 n=1 Tax=Chionoecetes opilio TaxID=41210 RepID=A0A8J4YUY3_CHIOP|nr:GDP-D-glucose phosphorylase 1 [Chionoecetes opilio]
MENDTKRTNDERETCFTYTKENFLHSTPSVHGQDFESPLDTLLLKKWMAAKAAGAFNYSVENIDTKILPGQYGLVAQVNVNRKTLRRKPDTILEIQQPVDPSKFNFTKIQEKEVLSKLKFLVSKHEDGAFGKEQEKDNVALKATLIVNNAPICHTHSLLVPFLEECWPQVLNHQGLAAAVHAILLSKSPDMRVAFNSLGAYASVNHLHFHIFYFPYTLFSETAECEWLAGPCYTFKKYFASGFAFQLEDGDVDKLVSSVMTLVNVFLKEKVAHNMFITRGTPLETVNTSEATYSTVRVMLWAQNFVTGAKSLDFINTAACELAGHVPVYSSEQWETLSEKKVLSLITPVCKDKYESILPMVTSVFQDKSFSMKK